MTTTTENQTTKPRQIPDFYFCSSKEKCRVVVEQRMSFTLLATRGPVLR